MVRFKTLFLSLIFLFATSCQQSETQKQTETTPEKIPTLEISKNAFGATPDGPADLYTLKNKNGMEVRITNYGGIITHLWVPDKNGKLEDVVLGFDNLEDYLGSHPYFGAIIGRYANRIAKGQFAINDKRYTLATNNAPNHLHGGEKGFDKVLWNALEVRSANSVGLELKYLSDHMEEGFPGKLGVKVLYSLNDQNEFRIDYEAIASETTVCNLTNHTYFNLAGAGSEDILDHELQINALEFTPVDRNLIPTGKLEKVANTALDFSTSTRIGDRIGSAEEQIQIAGGYDHNLVLNISGKEVVQVASLYEPDSGRLLEILTNEPGLQFYSGNFLDGSIKGKKGKTYSKRSGLCLETQHFPDSPNHPHFPSTFLLPSIKFASTTIWRFSVK